MKEPSTFEQTIELVRSILNEWDNGRSSRVECVGSLSRVLLEPLLEGLESGEEWLGIGSCCCSSHPPDREFTVKFKIEPHGFSAKRVAQ